MRKTILLFIGLILIMPVHAREKAKQTSKEQYEVYVPTVIIQGNWGSDPGKFGFFRQPAKGHDYPDMIPNAIAVDKNEHIYILDPVNERIAVYNEKGQYYSNISLKSLNDRLKIFDPWHNDIAVDSYGEIYLLTINMDYNGAAVVKINKDGKVLKQYYEGSKIKEFYKQRPKKYEKKLKEIKRENNATILDEQLGGIVRLFADGNNNIFINVEGGIYLKMGNTKLQKLYFNGSPSVNLKYIYVRKPEVPLKKYLKERPPPVEGIVIQDQKGNILNKIELQSIYSYFGHEAKIQNIKYRTDDIFENKYFEVNVDSVKNGDYIFKYNRNWEIINSILIEDISTYPYAISKNGNIYQLYWNSENMDAGIKVRKWENK